MSRMAGGVFLSYRRHDAPGYAGRLYDRLKARMEIGEIAPGYPGTRDPTGEELLLWPGGEDLVASAPRW